MLTWPPNSPGLNLIEHLWDVLEKQVQSMEAPPCNLHDLKDVMLTSGCLITQVTFRVFVDSISRQVRAALEARGVTTQYYEGGFNVIAERCKCYF